jgi:isoleucyl-tRNA synthetase
MISTLVFDEEAQRRLGLGGGLGAELGAAPSGAPIVGRVRGYPHPYRTCVVLGHVCDREGKKESKSKGNYTPPEVILERVRMEFAAFRAEGAKIAALAPARDGVAWVAREDYEGLDLTGESAKVVLYRADRREPVTMELRPAKGLARRVVGLTDGDLDRLGLVPGDNPLSTKPNDVPGLPQAERVYVEDPTTPAPGADAFRWFFYASSPPWTNTRHSLTNVRGAQKEFLVKLRNVYSFFTIYANIDGFSPAAGNPGATDTMPASLSRSTGYRAPRARSLLDRWMLSELSLATREVTARLERYELYEAAQRLIDLVDALSNWYVRRSRSRFWAPVTVGAPLGKPSTAPTPPAALAPQDKHDAYFTLYEALVAVAKLIAPFTPFFAEELYQNLVRRPWPATQPESVHLCAYPEPDAAAIDEPLALEMRAVRELVSLGLQVRTANKLKVRQPLARADVVVSQASLVEALAAHTALIQEELNVHEVRLLQTGEERGAVRYVLKPSFRALGPKLGKKVQVAKQVLAAADAAALRAELAAAGKVTIALEGEAVELGPDEIEVVVEASEGFAAAGGRAGVVVLVTALSDALRDEGLGREILSRVQGLRKDLDLGFTDRVRLAVDGSERVRRVAREQSAILAAEALAVEVVVGAASFAGERREAAVDGEEVVIVLARAG